MSLKVYGHSDDLIEVEGDHREEFVALNDGPSYIALSNGVLLAVVYNDDGEWAIRAYAGRDKVEIMPPGGAHAYSDVAHVSGDIEWVVFGSEVLR